MRVEEESLHRASGRASPARAARGLAHAAYLAEQIPWQKLATTWLTFAAQLAALVVVAAALLWPAPISPTLVPAGRTNSDLLVSHWPTAILIQQTWAMQHRLPLWNPYYGGGQPLAADPLAALFYPPMQLVHFLSLRDTYLVLFMGHLVFAGLGMLLLARRVLLLPRLPALVAAIAFEATPRLLSHLGAGHLTLIQTVAWYPWLALGCWAATRDPRRWGVPFASAIAMTLLAGHPQMAYYGLLMTVGLAVWLLVRRWRREGSLALLLSAGGLGLAAALGALLAAVHLVPLMEFTLHSTREVSVASTDAYPLPAFLAALFGQEQPSGIPWEGMVFPGTTVLVLAGTGLVFRWRAGAPLALGTAVVGALTMGNASLVYHLVAHVLPEFDRFRGLARIWFVALVPIALLAGLGADAALSAIRLIAPRAAVAGGLLAVLAVACTLVQTDAGYARVGDYRLLTTPNALELAAAQLAGSGRIYGVQRNMRQVVAVELKSPLADGWNPLLIESYALFMEHAGGYTAHGYQLTIPPIEIYVAHYPTHIDAQPNARLLGLMHVSVVLSAYPLTDLRLSLAGNADGTFIYRNTADAGAAYLVIPGSGGSAPALDHLQRLDPAAGIVVANGLAPEKQTFTISTSVRAYCVFAMPIFPGWTAQLDGRPARLAQIGGTLPAVLVGPGTHHVTYAYTPNSVPVGAALTALGLLGLLAWLTCALGWLDPARLRTRIAPRHLPHRSVFAALSRFYFPQRRIDQARD